MKLIFTKDASNEIDVQLQRGTIVDEFSYTEMVRQLLLGSVFDDTEFVNLSVEEQAKIQMMLDKISAVFHEEKTADNKEE